MSSLMPRISREEPEPKKRKPGWDAPNPNVDELPEVDSGDTDDDPFSEVPYRRIPPAPKPCEQPPMHMDGWVIS